MKKNRTNWARGAKIIFVASLMISFCEARYLGSYTARLSSQDHYNSRGGRLTKYYSILRQDRANYHKFGKSDTEDTGDNAFGSKKMRSYLPRMAKRGNISSSTRYAIESGTPLVEVEIYSDHINVSIKSSSSSTGSSSELLGSYTARLSSQDHYNSSGNRLTKYYSILRQDRANYHKFGKSDTEDTGDNAFGSKKMRSYLPSIAKRSNISSSVIDAIENGTPVVKVDIYANRLEIGLADSGSGMATTTVVSEESRQQSLLEKIKEDPETIKQWSKEDKHNQKLLIRAIIIAGNPLLVYLYEDSGEDSYFSDKALVMQPLKSICGIYSFLEPLLKADKDIVMTTVSHCGGILENVPKEFADDSEVVVAAVRSNFIALQYASKRLKNDRNIVMRAIDDGYGALCYAGDFIRKDMNVIQYAMDKNYIAFSCASKSYLSDKQKNEPPYVYEKRCMGCHSKIGSVKAFGKSKIIANMGKREIINALHGYRDNTYGGTLKSVMRAQVKGLTENDIEEIAEYLDNWTEESVKRQWNKVRNSR